MQLADKIYGNESVRDALLRAVHEDRLCHAYLFYGEEGIGKKTLASWFAKLILCESPHAEGACGHCQACRSVESETHPDLYIAPYDKPLPVAAVREIKQRSFVKPNSGRYNVFIIPQADRMEGPSFNALLKVLEEPPGNTVFLLTAADKATTPQTISSRCIPITVQTLHKSQLKDMLISRTDADEARIEQAIRIADGNPGKALRLLTDPEQIAALQTASALYEAICRRKEYVFLQLTQSKIGDKQKFILVNDLLKNKLHDELLSGGKISGLKISELSEMIRYCQKVSGMLRKPFSMNLMSAGYAAGIFAQIK